MGEVAVEVFVGVDVAKAKHWCQAITVEGIELFSRQVANDEAALGRLIDAAGREGQAALVVDVTGSAAQLLLAVAADRRVPVAYVTGLAMRRAADLYPGSAKTDPRDAWVLADHARRNADRLTWVELNEELLVRLRVLGGHDEDPAAGSVRTINRLRDAMLSISPGLERVLGEKLAQRGVREALRRWPTPAAMRTAGKTRIRNLLRKHYPRKPQTADKLADRIWAALAAQTLTLAGEATWGEVITSLVNTLDRIVTERRDLATAIEEAFLSHPLGKVLITIPGVGPRTGARILVEVGHPQRFANGSRLASYAGLAPTDWNSGTIRRGFHSRRGNHRLKNAMFQAAFSASRHDPAARIYYQRKQDQGKGHNAALICVARRRCNMILAILKSQTPYRLPDSTPHAA